MDCRVSSIEISTSIKTGRIILIFKERPFCACKNMNHMRKDADVTPVKRIDSSDTARV
ncbi:MAG: hypothetical protein ACUVQV_05425 [Dissulfurimicrobium sp.]|uniref:hypothetical protein n=1 Tax=Dissulfurimicrobium sp. TaxID=2022436 RepID=UPI00404B458F